MSAQAIPFKIHLSVPVHGAMVEQTRTVKAVSADAARKALLADESLKGAIIRKTKRVRS